MRREGLGEVGSSILPEPPKCNVSRYSGRYTPLVSEVGKDYRPYYVVSCSRSRVRPFLYFSKLALPDPISGGGTPFYTFSKTLGLVLIVVLF